MSTLDITPTPESFGISFNPDKGHLRIFGRSLQNDPQKYFAKLFQHLEDYSEHPLQTTTLELYIEYANTPSLKQLFMVINKLKELIVAGKKLKVIWEYEEDDEDMKIAGIKYQDLLSLSFVLREVASEDQ